MTKIIKNTTAADILHASTGVNFLAGVSSVLDPSIYNTIADSQTFSLLGSGDFSAGDGTQYFAAVDGWSFLTGALIKQVAISSIPAFAAKTLGVKSLFKRVVGVQQDLVVGDNTITYTETFPWVKFMAIEIINCEALDRVSLFVLDSVTGQVTGVANYRLNQFGYTTNLSKDWYVQRSEFDADLYAGLQIRILYTSLSAKRVGVNFVMNEVK